MLNNICNNNKTSSRVTKNTCNSKKKTKNELLLLDKPKNVEKRKQ